MYSYFDGLVYRWRQFLAFRGSDDESMAIWVGMIVSDEVDEVVSEGGIEVGDVDLAHFDRIENGIL